jgi:hypothetical protein
MTQMRHPAYFDPSKMTPFVFNLSFLGLII